MRYLKRFALVCLLLAAVMAVAGVSTAAAEQSTFCKVDETPCSAGNHYPSGTEVVLRSKGTMKWVNEEEVEGMPFFLFVAECKEAEFRGSTSTTGSGTSPVEIAFSTQTFSSCSGCSFVSLKLPKMKVNWTSGTMNGSVTSQGPEYTFTCSTIFGKIDCAYGGEIKEGVTMTGGNPALLTFKEAPLAKTSGFEGCGTQVKLSVEFEVAAPKPLYVSSS